MNQEKIQGKIKWYKENKGYGYIIGKDYEKYFFERIDCINKNENFQEGQLVSFIPVFTEINYAKEVEKINFINK